MSTIEMTPDTEKALRFLATLHELDAPSVVEVLSAVIVLRDSNDPEILRAAGKAVLRNLQRLEDALDDARADAKVIYLCQLVTEEGLPEPELNRKYIFRTHDNCETCKAEVANMERSKS
jgi:hypothetical protein